jgi:adenylate cyclase
VYTDIAGFTTLSERLQERVVPLLNEYMGVMVPLVHAHGGYLNKFLGDGIMFFCGAPRQNNDHAADAIATVLRMQQAMAPFNQGLAERKLPRLQMRCGVATGAMIVGDAGPAQRSDYTVLGPMANLGARLESANKHTGTLILVNDRAAELTGDLFLFSPVAKLRVVGIDHGVVTYEPLAFTAEATDKQKRHAQLWRGVVDAFIAGRFDQSLEAIHAMDREIGVTKLTELYRELNERYLRQPPGEGFDGSIVLESK